MYLTLSLTLILPLLFKNI